MSTIECMRSYSTKWREEQSFIPNHTSCVKMLSKYESSLPPAWEQINAKVNSHSKWREEQSFILINTHLVLECDQNMKVTYHLSTSECTSSHSSKWREELSFILNHPSCVRMLTKHESNLPSEHKWMHEVTQKQVERRATIHS